MKTRPTVLAALLLAGVDGAAAAEPPVAVDAEFLEFLGCKSWRGYGLHRGDFGTTGRRLR